jgi:hypothetical protein
MSICADQTEGVAAECNIQTRKILSEVRTWIVQQCNVYGKCTVRASRLQQEFGRDGVIEEKEVTNSAPPTSSA